MKNILIYLCLISLCLADYKEDTAGRLSSLNKIINNLNKATSLSQKDLATKILEKWHEESPQENIVDLTSLQNKEDFFKKHKKEIDAFQILEKLEKKYKPYQKGDQISLTYKVNNKEEKIKGEITKLGDSFIEVNKTRILIKNIKKEQTRLRLSKKELRSKAQRQAKEELERQEKKILIQYHIHAVKKGYLLIDNKLISPREYVLKKLKISSNPNTNPNPPTDPNPNTNPNPPTDPNSNPTEHTTSNIAPIAGAKKFASQKKETPQDSSNLLPIILGVILLIVIIVLVVVLTKKTPKAQPIIAATPEKQKTPTSPTIHTETLTDIKVPMRPQTMVNMNLDDEKEDKK